MLGICLPPQTITKFKQALVSGKINPAKLSAMTSDERHKLLAEVVGEGNAKFVNANFEEKLLLKNQQQGFLTWAKQVAGVTPEIRRDLISRIQKLDKVLTPEEEKLFLKDLAATKLGFGVSAKEAKQITNMSAKLQEAAAKQRPDGTFASEAERMAYGYAKVDMGGYLANLKNQAEKKTLLQLAKQDPGESITKLAGLAKSVKASLDNSAIFRQGWKTLWTNPGVWQKNARQSFVDLVRQFGGKPVMREVLAEIVSRPNYSKYEKMKLAVGNIEEEFPSQLPEKIPGLGRAFKASESAYTAFLYRTRADVADKYLDVATKTGVNINDKEQMVKLGKLINALTGRGDIGRFEGKTAVALNNVFFSVKFFKSNLDTLTAHQLQKGVRWQSDPAARFVKKQAAKNLFKIAAGTAAVLAIADQLKPGSVEWDPRSTDFGKIRAGNTRFDVTGGMSSLVVLASQIIKQEKKSSTTGIVSKFNDGPMSSDGMDTFFNFFENKLSPLASVVKDIVKQEDFHGNKPTPASTAKNLLVPIPITVQMDSAKDPQAADLLIIGIADGLGIGANTYGKSDRKPSESKEAAAFKQAVGEQKFQEANTKYNTEYDKWLADHRLELNSLPPDQQQSILTSAKNKIQKNVYKQYGFKPPKPSEDESLKASKKRLVDSIK